MLGIKSWSDVRAFAYVALPLIASALAFVATKDTSRAAGWAALAAALSGPVLALVRTPDGANARRALYAVVAVVQAFVGAVALTGGWGSTVSEYLPLILSLVGLLAGGTAAANTTTTPDLTPTAEQAITAAGDAAKAAVTGTLSQLPARTLPPLVADAVNTITIAGTSTAVDTAEQVSRQLGRHGWGGIR